MPRSKRGTLRTKKRKKVLQHTKGFKWRRKNVFRLAKDAMRHAMANAFVGRKQKKRNMRQLWQIKINAASRKNDTTYSKFMHALKQKNIELDRKVLADLAENDPEVFAKLVEKVR
ncbi:MAG: 50S ribosomal protein L20 [Candidatus Spechtbacterales bacterium]